MTENTPALQTGDGAPWRDLPVTLADGQLHDPYHLLDTWHPGPTRSDTWVNQQIKRATTARTNRDAAITAAAQLDPTDTSERAQHLRDVAEQARDHNQMSDKRAEWAAALLQADPTLADRLDPAARHDAEQLLHAEQAADIEPVEATRDTRIDDATDTADTGSEPSPAPMSRAQLADALWEGRLSPAEAERLDPRLAGMAAVLGMSEAEANTRTNHNTVDCPPRRGLLPRLAGPGRRGPRRHPRRSGRRRMGSLTLASEPTGQNLEGLPLLVSVPEAARILGLKRSTAYRLAASGELPCRRLGGRVYVVTSKLHGLVEDS